MARFPRNLKVLCPLLLLLLPATGPAQTKKAPKPAPAPAVEPAYVTIYSHALSLTSFMPGTKNGFYSGRLYDGDHQLAHIGPNRFVTFAVPPGSHTFANNSMSSSSSDGGGTVTLDLQSGQHYFLLASIKVSQSVFGLAFLLKEVSCTVAQSANKKSQFITDKDFFPAGQKLAATDTTFPACPATDADADPQTPKPDQTDGPPAPKPWGTPTSTPPQRSTPQ